MIQLGPRVKTPGAGIGLQEIGERLIISDMARPPDPRAGYTLLDALGRRRVHIPVVLYTGSASAAHVAEARARGAAGQTASPRELIAIVTEILGGD